ncbi:NACHT domain-containing protein [Actinoplanes sp. CA-142083]|uniref:NACHT domain-containing protein n=1 Tax=Actinoplanes sp. CA-142083 TaxID=3239903 RepID=UPI003D8E7522
MPKGLSYADAVKLLGGKGPLATTIDNLLGGLLSVATLGGSEAALGFFDAKAEMVRLSGLLTAKINDSVRGLGRHDRSQRLLAAHAVLVVTAFFDALDEFLPEDAGLSRNEQLRRIGVPPGEDVIYRLISSRIPMPSADRSYDQLLNDLSAWYRRMSAAPNRVSRRAVELYDRSHRRLAEEIPEFAIWAGRLESRAAARSLERLESLLLRTTSGADPSAHRAALDRVYRAELSRPVLSGDAGRLALPKLGEAYIDPRFRVKEADPAARPSAETWWSDTTVRSDVDTFLATYLTTAQAVEAPMLLLGQPGAGKSSLTKILAARLPASDFFVVRVPLRDVPAEADLQGQVEFALRRAIGETVAWAALARESGEALPVILLDGLDELLQTTGVHQSNFLERVAEFQEREAALDRPVAVMVTSRIAVADWARLPGGTLVVRLEPFDDHQIERWAGVWNEANRGRLPAPLDPGVLTLARFRGLAEQPLLLLMLALYDADANALRDDAAALDGGQLYERLLTRFAQREVERVHADRTAELVEEELTRLAVVAFAMFNRNRLWVTAAELDDDLAGLDLAPSRVPDAAGFRTPLTAGQEMVGRFFFIHRGQARRDEKDLHTYEFLHATFGEYLIARLLVQTLREVAAREAVAARGLRLRGHQEDDPLQALLGFTPLTVRNTVLPFVRGLIGDDERETLRAVLVRRTSQAVTRPTFTPSRYQPVDKRIDHWMAIHSLNLVLLVLACGGELRASELFTLAADPADWLRGTALQWRAACPGGMWLEALENVTVRRDWHEGRRDLIIDSGDTAVEPVDADWSNRVPPGLDPLPSDYVGNFPLGPALKSMHLSNNLSDDALLHTLEPVLRQMPDTVKTFVGLPARESVARSLIHLWLTSAMAVDLTELAYAYHRAANAVAALDAGDGRAATVLLRSLLADVTRLRAQDVLAVIDQVIANADAWGRALALQCLIATELTNLGAKRDDLLASLFVRSLTELETDLQSRVLRAVLASPRAGETLVSEIMRVARPREVRRLETLAEQHPGLAAALTEAGVGFNS